VASAASAFAGSAPGIGSTVSGHDSAGGQFSFAFDALTHGSQYGRFKDGVIQPFPAVNHSHQSFHVVFSTKFQDGSGSKNEPGKAVVSISGRIRQTSGPVGGPGKAIADGTIGIRVNGACHTGTLTWSAKGSIVSPG
jgi:hypothetical protein